MNDGLSERHREKIIGVLERSHELARVYLYGSRAKGTYRRESDVDLVVETVDGAPLGWASRLALLAALHDLDLPIEVDITDRASISDAGLIKSIQRDAVLWWETEHAASAAKRTAAAG